MTEKGKAYIAAIIYAFIIGLSFMFVKLTLTIASPLDTLAHRFTIALLGATLLLLLTKEKLKFSWRDLLQILPLALLYPILFFALQVFGLVRTSSSEAGIIQAAVPIFTLIFASLLLKERATRGQLVFMSLSVIGVIYMIIMNGVGAKTSHLIGTGLILFSTAATGLYQVLARKLTQRYSLLTLTYVMTLLGFIVFNLLAIGTNIANGTMATFFQPFTHMDFVISIIYLGIFSSLGTSYLSNYVLSKIEASKMSVFSNLATLITILAGVIVLQEAFHHYHFLGAIAIIIGVIGTNYFGGKSTRYEKNDGSEPIKAS